MCIDRQRMADELFFGQSQILDSYAPPTHPLVNPEARHYDFDPQAAAELLQSVGWLDLDNDPATPRLSQGVPGLPGGIPFEFTYLTTDEEEKQRAAQIVKDSLAQCGIQVNVATSDWNDLLAPGPDGPVFGRNFSMAQFGWVTALQPPCFLYTSTEIPGPYPEYPKGWGGANASGYSNPDFDGACQQAFTSLPDTPEHQEAHFRAQAIFAEELPAVPLYLRLKLVAMRPDMCNVVVDASAESALWNLEAFDYGENCGS
jgi:peptide/nickel transport system substrate-binding protein